MMRSGPLEFALEVSTCGWFAACAGVAAGLAGAAFGINAVAAGVGAGAVGLAIAGRVVGLGRQNEFPMPQFDLSVYSPGERDELLLTDRIDPPATSAKGTSAVGELILTLEQRLTETAASATSDELLLDDILIKIEPHSRVVQLFDPDAMPTAGELQARIERHLNGPPRPVPDAAQALNSALTELRRSLR